LSTLAELSLLSDLELSQKEKLKKKVGNPTFQNSVLT